MSSGGPNTQRFSPFTPPLRGSFPLDRQHECDEIVNEYLTCIKDYNSRQKNTLNKDHTASLSASNACQDSARKYFDCRMRAGLMTKEDLNNLGFTAGEAEVDREFIKKEQFMAEFDEKLAESFKEKE